MTPERDAAAAPKGTAANVQLRATTTLYRNFITEVVPRIEFAESLANRTVLRLDGLTPDEALLAISTTLAIAGRWAS